MQVVQRVWPTGYHLRVRRRRQHAHLGWSEAEPSKFYSLKHVFDMVKNLISQYFVLHVSLFSMHLFMVSICLCEFVEWSLYP